MCGGHRPPGPRGPRPGTDAGRGSDGKYRPRRPRLAAAVERRCARASARASTACARRLPASRCSARRRWSRTAPAAAATCSSTARERRSGVRLRPLSQEARRSPPPAARRASPRSRAAAQNSLAILPGAGGGRLVWRAVVARAAPARDLRGADRRAHRRRAAVPRPAAAGHRRRRGVRPQRARHPGVSHAACPTAETRTRRRSPPFAIRSRCTGWTPTASRGHGSAPPSERPTCARPVATGALSRARPRSSRR